MDIKTGRNASMKTKSVGICTIGLRAALALYACVLTLNEHAIAGEGNLKHLRTYLREMGDRLDCYFIVEGVCRRYAVPIPILDTVDYEESEDIRDIDSMVSFLNKISLTWKYDKPEALHLVANRMDRNNKIIRIRDSRLSDVEGYILNKKVSVEYHGTPQGLLKFLSIQYPLFQERRVTSTGMEYGLDGTTPINVSVKDTRIEDLLTECIPLSGYNRIIWSSCSDGKSESPIVIVEFYGKIMK
jgi:hypothetical protein